MTTPAVPVQLACTRWGSGGSARRALLLHGVGSAAGTWWQLADGLAHAGFAVTAPDLRGHGTSPRTAGYRIADHVEDLRALGGGWDLLVGHSLGGLLAVAAAARDPGFAARLLLLDPVLEIPDDVFPALVTEQVAEVADPPLAGALAAQHPHWHPEDVAARVAAAAAVSPHVVERTLRDNHPWHYAHLAARLAVPTRILAADPSAGALFDPALAAWLAANAPLVTVTTVAGAGHGVQRDAPAAVLAAALGDG